MTCERCQELENDLERAKYCIGLLLGVINKVADGKMTVDNVCEFRAVMEVGISEQKCDKN